MVRIPNWLGDIVLSIPALSQLNQLGDSVAITIIGKKSFLPLVQKIFSGFNTLEISDKEYNSLSHIWKFCKDVKKQEQTIYITLTPSFLAAYMGWSLRGKGSQTVGYRTNFRNYFLTKSVPKIKNLHRSEEYNQLIQSIDFLNLRDEKNKTDYAQYFMKLPPYGLKSKQYIVINVNSEAASRRLPEFQWKRLIEKLSDHELVFIGTKKEEGYTSDVIENLRPKKFLNLAGQTDIIQLCQILAHAKCSITNDSGPAHLSSLMNCPTIVFFGAGDENSTCPLRYASEVVVIRENVPCSPCLKNKCPIKTLDCLNAIDMDDAFLKIKNFL